MKKICEKNKCTGCGACVYICPCNCISLEEDIEGFLQPQIDNNKCCECGKCKNICPSNSDLLNENISKPKVYASQIIDKDILFNSSSGGAFSALAIPFIEDGGVVFASKMDDSLEVYHSMADSIKDLKSFQGSKYVQSNTYSVYDEILKLLKENRKVMYIGCPCQVAGLNSIVDKKFIENLITVDLVCHGIVAYSFFKKYIKEKEELEKKKLIKYEFRNKEKNTNQYVVKATFSDGSKKFIKAYSDEYLTCYLKQAIYRECCYSCKYANIPRVGDFTIGDYVGVDEKTVSKIVKDKGISMILLNNKKANDYFEKIKNNMNVWERNLEEATSSNLCLIRPSQRPSSRDHIFKDKDLSVKELRDKYCKITYKNKIAIFIGPEKIRKIKQIVKKQ